MIPFRSLLAAFGAAVLVFLAQSIEYKDMDYDDYVQVLAGAAVILTVISTLLVAQDFKRMGVIEIAFAIACFAGLPFVAELLLKWNRTQLNVHGYAIFGYFLYLVASELCAIGLLIALAVRAFRRPRSLS
jgi:hypothetical protein